MDTLPTKPSEEQLGQIRAWLMALIVIAVVAALASLAMNLRRSFVPASPPVAVGSVTWTGSSKSGPSVKKSAREVGSVTELTVEFENLTGDGIVEMVVTSVSFEGKIVLSTPTKLGQFQREATSSRRFDFRRMGRKADSVLRRSHTGTPSPMAAVVGGTGSR